MTGDAPADRDEPATAVPDPRDRRQGDRRSGADRRGTTEPPAGVDRRAGDRRAGSDRRSDPAVPPLYRAGKRSINEYPLSGDELAFINAINAYKRQHGRPFPTWSEVLHVLFSLGYRKPATDERQG